MPIQSPEVVWINGKTALLAIVLYLPFTLWIMNIVATDNLEKIRTTPLWIFLGYHAVAITTGSLYRQRLVRKMKLAQLKSQDPKNSN
jgi:hypothetical protein